MRLLWLTFVFGALTAGEAMASSFVHVAPPPKGASPSIIVMGEPAPSSVEIAAAPPTQTTVAKAADGTLVPLAFALPDMTPSSAVKPVIISASIIAFDAPVPPVTFEQVAAIDSQPAHRQSAPMVIRGGIVGAAFERVVVPDAPREAKRQAQDEPKTASDASPGEKEPVAKPRRRPAARQEEAPEPPAETTPMPEGATSAPQ